MTDVFLPTIPRMNACREHAVWRIVAEQVKDAESEIHNIRPANGRDPSNRARHDARFLWVVAQVVIVLLGLVVD